MSLVLLALPAVAAAQQTGDERAGSAPASGSTVLPEPIVTPVEYPEGATGSASIALELTIDVDGRVRDVRVLDGAEPFASVARAAALDWRFRPATRDGKPVPARFRFSARFTAPESEREPEPKPEPEPSQPAARPSPWSRRTSSSRGPGNKPRIPAPLEVVVTGDRRTPGSVTVTREEARALPGTFGDPLRAIDAQPGVVPVVSGLPAYFIRGAPPSNVGFFIDGVDLPLLYHAFLGPSVVHPMLIAGIEFYPGAAPVQYGRFAGPVIAVRTQPVGDRFRAVGTLRTIDVGAYTESPLGRCPETMGHACAGTGARIAGRYSYTGLVLSLLSDSKLDYWDYLAEVKHALGPDDSVGLFAFGGYDFFRAPQQTENSGGKLSFHRVDARWDHHFGEGTDLRTAITAGYDRAAGAIEDSSVVADRSLRGRLEFTHELGRGATFKAGGDVRLDFFELQTNPRYTSYPDYSTLFPGRTDTVVGAYVGLDLVPARGIHVLPGVRADVYRSLGETAIGVDPRIAAEFDVGHGVRVDHSLGIAHQRPNFAAQVPGAQVADLEGGLQWALLWSSGIRAQLPMALTGSATVYRTAYFNALDPIGGARDFTIDRTLLDRRSTVSGAGLELKLSRPLTRSLGGFVSYTLSHSRQSSSRFDSLTGSTASSLEGPSGFDRPHVLQVALGYALGRGYRAAVRGITYSGVPEHNLQGQPHFTGQRRGRAYLRLDVQAEKRWDLQDGRYWSIGVEVLNATSTSEVVRLDCGQICRERVAGPVILPSVALEFGL